MLVSAVALRAGRTKPGLQIGARAVYFDLINGISAELRHGAACVLEGTSEAVPGVLPDRGEPGHHLVRTHLVPPDQQADRQPAAAAARRRSDARAGRRRRQGPRLRGRQGRLHPDRGRRGRSARDREQAHHRDRQLRAVRADRQALLRQSVLHRAERRRRPGGVRGHPRCHEGQGHGGARPHRAAQARARHRAGAVRQGPARQHAALRLRGPQGRGLFLRHLRHQGAGRDAQARRAHSRDQEGRLRSGEVRGSLRECAGRTAAQEAGRLQAAEGQGSGGTGAQCHQPDGCAAPQRPEGSRPAGREASRSISREIGGSGRKAEEGAASASPARPNCCCRSRARARPARPRPPSPVRPPSPRPPRRSPVAARPADREASRRPRRSLRLLRLAAQRRMGRGKPHGR